MSVRITSHLAASRLAESSLWWVWVGVGILFHVVQFYCISSYSSSYGVSYISTYSPILSYILFYIIRYSLTLSYIIQYYLALSYIVQYTPSVLFWGHMLGLYQNDADLADGQPDTSGTFSQEDLLQDALLQLQIHWHLAICFSSPIFPVYIYIYMYI